MARDSERDCQPKPMNVEQIVKMAHFDYNPHVPLRYWLRTAGTLVKEVMTLETHLLRHHIADEYVGQYL